MLLQAMREMRNGEGADYDAITFDNFYDWWLDHKGDKKGAAAKSSKVRIPSFTYISVKSS